MYLSKVEIVGFKSFPIKTDLLFTDGLTAIVGPNGCGKTNIVDAIRWALGEQKAGVLRSDIMEDVIFNGTRSRKPVGMAEVAITVLNNKQVLPLGFSEITIKRRLFRNGESQYLLNNTQCRLRDITELFMDTGMGADAYSVIELKMVESILSERAEERRHLFEEAAGVTKYKTRRREAARKLSVVHEDIARVEDIIAEVQKKVNSLARQADKARQYKEIEEKAHHLEQYLVRWEYLSASVSFAEVESEFASLQKQKSKLHDNIITIEAHLRQVESEQEKSRGKFEHVSQREQEMNRAIGQLSQQSAIASERKYAAENSRSRLNAESAEAAKRLEQLSAKLTETTNSRNLAREKTIGTEELYEKCKATRKDAAAAVNSLRQQYVVLEKKNESTRNSIANIRAKNERSIERLAGSQRRKEELQTEIKKITAQRNELRPQYEAHIQRRNDFADAIRHAEEALKSVESRTAELRIQKEKYQNRLSELRSESAHAKASLDFLGGLVDEAESSQYLLKSKDWQGDKSLLAELVGVDEVFRVAVDAALGDAGRCFVVQSRKEALICCAMLKSAGKGKSTFICRDEIRPFPTMPTPPENSLGWISEIIRCDDDIRNAMRGLLGRSALVESLEIAFALVAEGKVDAAISISGEIARANGMVRGGSVVKTEGLRVGKREQIAVLQEKITDISASAAGIEQEISAISKELSDINIPYFIAAVRRAESEKNTFEQQESQIRFRLNSLDQSLHQLSSQTERIELDITAAKSESEAFAAEYEKLQKNTAEDEEITDRATSEIRNAEAALAASDASLQQAQITAIRAAGERDAAQREIVRINEQIASEKIRIDQSENELKTLAEQLELIVRSGKSAAEETELLRNQRDALRETKDSIQKIIQEQRNQQQTIAQEIRAQREQHDRLTTIAHERELRLAEYRSRIEALRQNAFENLTMTEEELSAANNDEPPTQEHHQELKRHKQKLASLGNVNFLAVEEFKQENERLVFLKEQSEDLRQSKQTLDETISEINTTAKQRFNEIFGIVAKNFSELFGLLFGEHAEAVIRLAEGDPLEADIEITAKPAGKRPQSIELLSAGEKTLTAIALLFAIYLVKPSPFCILDEVDAPLDDANIERYLQLIRKFSENTQFLIVTHNKKTMEAADILYGVTQEEEGVSRVVSAKLSERKTMQTA